MITAAYDHWACITFSITSVSAGRADASLTAYFECFATPPAKNGGGQYLPDLLKRE